MIAACAAVCGTQKSVSRRQMRFSPRGVDKGPSYFCYSNALITGHILQSICWWASASAGLGCLSSRLI
ncbi:MAG: hypothetical protein GY822_15445 [Deltaproteobacteria bacterium]|nr:hypothetical protein [Deltaproteobacteria bacterium]